MPVNTRKLRETLIKDVTNPDWLREPQWTVCRAITGLVDDGESTVLKISRIRGKHNLTSDEPATRGGADKGPAPIEIMMASFGQCLATVYAYMSSLFDMKLDSVEVDSRCYIDQRGVYDAVALANRGFDRIVYETRISSPEPGERVLKLVESAERSCPAHGTLRKACPMEGTIILNGLPLVKINHKPGKGRELAPVDVSAKTVS